MLFNGIYNFHFEDQEIESQKVKWQSGKWWCIGGKQRILFGLLPKPVHFRYAMVPQMWQKGWQWDEEARRCCKIFWFVWWVLSLFCFVLIGWRQGIGSLWGTEGEKVDNGVQLTQNTIGKEIHSSQERITLHSIVIFSFKAERKR